MTLLRIVRRGLDLELLDGAGGWHERNAPAIRHVWRPVERELVAARSAISREVGRSAVVEWAGEFQVAVVRDARRQPREYEGIAIGERHQRDALLVDDL